MTTILVKRPPRNQPPVADSSDLEVAEPPKRQQSQPAAMGAGMILMPVMAGTASLSVALTNDNPIMAVGGLLSGVWLGLFVGLVFSFFVDKNVLEMIVSTVVLGALFGVAWALLGYALTRGQRDFSSVTQVVATRYEVLVEHKVAAQAREMLAKLPGALPNPFA